LRANFLGPREVESVRFRLFGFEEEKKASGIEIVKRSSAGEIFPKI